MDARNSVNDILPPTVLLGLEQRLLARWRGRPSLRAERLLVGFSGGTDSLALALALCRIAEPAGLVASLAHIDHRQRASSRAEAAQAAAMAARLGLPFSTRHIPEDRLQCHRGLGVEEALRRERYRALAAIAREHDAAALVVAHQADDQAETILMHLMRGAGLHGSAAMAEWTERTIPWWPEASEPPAPLVIWRPFLTEQRATLRDYLAPAGLTPIDDPSNEDPRFRRNAIRRDVLPLLERIVPGAAMALARHAALAAEEDAMLDDFASCVLDRARRADGSVRVAPLLDAPAPLRRRAVRSWLAGAAPDVELSAERTAAALALAASGRGGGVVEIGSGWRIARGRGVLRLDRNGERAGEAG